MRIFDLVNNSNLIFDLTLYQLSLTHCPLFITHYQQRQPEQVCTVHLAVLVMSLMASFCAVRFPTGCLGRDQALN